VEQVIRREDEQLRLLRPDRFGTRNDRWVAMLQLDSISPQTAEKITEYRSIIGFRHVLVYGYDNLNPITVWNVVETKLDTLLQQARKLL